MTVLKEGAAMAQLGGIMGVMTVVFMAVMTAWILWTWLPSRRALLDRVALMPLEEDH